jgi:hypothetical protein
MSEAERNLGLTVAVTRAMNELMVDMAGKIEAAMKLIDVDPNREFIETAGQLVKQSQETYVRVEKFLMTVSEHSA